ncbi:hypothetical protein ES705_39592 [subsurface metagenome]
MSPVTGLGVIVPLRCKSWSCPHCAPRKRHAWINRFAAGEPEREMTLTTRADPSLTPVEIATRMKGHWVKFVAEIRKVFGPFEYALVWELTKAGTPHCHVLTRGSYIPQRWLSSHWHALGEGENVDIRSVKKTRAHAAHLCKYLGKDTGQTALHLTGLRIIQVSNGYDLPSREPSPSVKYEDYVWSFIGMRPPQVLKELENSSVKFRATPTPEDGYELTLENPDHTIDMVWDNDTHSLGFFEVDIATRSPP